MPPVWPPDDNWHIREGEASFKSISFRVAGRPKEILTILIQSLEENELVTTEQLRKMIWGRKDVEPQNLTHQICELQKILRKGLRLPKGFNPIVLNAPRTADANYCINPELEMYVGRASQ